MVATGLCFYRGGQGDHKLKVQPMSKSAKLVSSWSKPVDLRDLCFDNQNKQVHHQSANPELSNKVRDADLRAA